MDYKILEWTEANNFKKEASTEFYKNLNFNSSSIYKLKDSSYLICPLNPFGRSLLTKDKKVLDKWIDEKYFPTKETANDFYLKHKDIIDNLSSNKQKLKNDLLKLDFFKDKINNEESLNIKKIDEIYKILKNKNLLETYKLNFIVLIGDFIINNSNDKNYELGLIKSNQLLNPINQIVLITGKEKLNFYNLEDNVFGKYGYFGLTNIIKSINQFSRKANELDTIIRY